MTDIAIRVENLSKLYRIGPREPYKALRDSLTNAMYAPFRLWRKHGARGKEQGTVRGRRHSLKSSLASPSRRKGMPKSAGVWARFWKWAPAFIPN